MKTGSRESRNRILDLFRLGLAGLVLLSHAPEITDGDSHRELMTRAFHSGPTMGGTGVIGFFLLSGFLILRSWISDPSLVSYLRKRVLRIVPGYLVAALASTLAVGLILPTVPQFFAHLGWPYAKSLLLLQAPATPLIASGVFHYLGLVNGALWTIAYEFRCYLLVALLGLSGALRYRWIWLGIAVFALVGSMTHDYHGWGDWFRHTDYFGESSPTYWLLGSFMTGGCFLLWKDEIPFRPWMAVTAAAALLVCMFHQKTATVALIVLGGYLLFYAGSLRHAWLSKLGNFPDISYGVYLYGWPTEILLIYVFRNSPWLVFFLSLPITAACGWLSWHFVERPALKLARRHTARLPGP